VLEWSSRNLLAVDVVDNVQAQLVAAFLLERGQQRQLIYETGRR
jgi:hypothetical protein